MVTKMVLPGMEMMKGMGIGPLNIGNVLDTMGFVKKAWGAMNAPTAFMPTMDVEELNKRIVDLQAVEQWLMMNLSMIQGSIQALEVQRATIETLKGVTRGFVPGNLAAAFPGMNFPQDASKGAQGAGTAPQLPPGYYFSPPPAPAPVIVAPVGAPAEAPVSHPEPSRVRRAAVGSAKNKAVKGGAALGKDPGLSATAWLEFLQSQFNQVTQAAMSGATLKSAAKSMADTMAGSVAGTVAKSAVKAGAKAASKAVTRAAKGAGSKVSSGRASSIKLKGKAAGKSSAKAGLAGPKSAVAPGRAAVRSGASGKSKAKS